MTETLLVRPEETHDRITEAYLGRMGKTFMQATRKRIHWICAQARGQRVLDIGCSQGITAILLARDGFEVTGVDIDPHAVAEARDWLAAEPEAVQGRVRFVGGDAAAMPVADPYDTVILGEILEHLEDPAALVAAAARHLAPGGRLVVTVPFGIHDYPDHRQTFYLAAPHRMLGAHVALDTVEIIDRWIGLAGSRPANGAAPGSTRLDDAGLDLLENGFQALERRLRHETERVRAQNRTLEQEAGDAEASIADLNSQLLEVRAEAEEARDEAARLQAALAALEADAAALRKDHVRLTQQQRRIEYDARNTRESVSFRLGHALVLAAKSPRRLLSLPREAAALFREGRAKQPAHRRGVAVEAPSNRLTGEARTRLMATFGEGGAEAVRAEIVAAQAGSPEDAAQALVAAAVTLADEGHREAGPLLVGEAVRLDRNETTLRALFWTTQKQGDYRAAGRAFADIEQIVGPEPTPQQKRWLEKLRKSPVHVVSAAAHIPPRAAPGPFEAGRICYVLHNAQPYSSGGYATRAHGLARGLAKAGWEVVALTRPGFPLDTKPELLPEDVPVETVLDGIAYRTIHGPKRHDLSRRDYMVAAADAIEAALVEIRPEIVIAASAHLSALPALIAARRLGLPFVYEVRGFWEVTRQSRKPALEGTAGHRVDVALEAIVAEEADHVFTLTEPMREELFARGVETPITLLPNSCDPDRFTPRPRDAGLAARLGIPPDVPVIGYIGTFVQYEGLEYLATACARLAAEGRDFRLLLVGNEDTSGSGRGPITTEILATAVESGLAGRLIMPGRVPHEEVEAYYSLIDIAPFPRKPQPVTEMVSPMKPLEALAMEKAVVVSSVRALTEMIRHEETGLVFEKGSVDSLTATLARLIDDPNLRARLGRTARDWVVRGRTWDATAERAASELARLRLAPPAVPTPLVTDA